MKILSILFVLGISAQAQAIQTVQASGLAADCCFRTIGDIDLIIDAAEDAKENLLLECKKLYGVSGYLKFASENVSAIESAFEPGGASITINASATCLQAK